MNRIFLVPIHSRTWLVRLCAIKVSDVISDLRDKVIPAR